MQASAATRVGPAERDVLGQAEQQQEEDRQRQPDQRVLDRVDGSPRLMVSNMKKPTKVSSTNSRPYLLARSTLNRG